MIVRWSVDEIVEVTSGSLLSAESTGALIVDNVTQDSRNARRGSLFVPLVAERDGHAFIAAAIRAGACAYLTNQRTGVSMQTYTHTKQKPEQPTTVSTRTGAPMQTRDPASSVAVIEVEDTGEALTSLAKAARRRIDGTPVVGVTGSVGKTTTKDLIASVLYDDRQVHSNKRSLNNEIGLPLTLLETPDDISEKGGVVLEMGSRGAGHIRRLCHIARPTMGVITTVGLAHTSEFGHLEDVIAAKRELVESLPTAQQGGVAFLNADVPEVASMSAYTRAAVVTYGIDEEADVMAQDLTLDKTLKSSFMLVDRLTTREQKVDRIRVKLGARGLHAVSNALAAAAVGLELGVSIHGVALGLRNPRLSPLRMELTRLPEGTIVLNDSYNANPLSMRAALHALTSLPCKHRIAVLGVMAELGEYSSGEHASIATEAIDSGMHVIAVDAPEYIYKHHDSDLADMSVRHSGFARHGNDIGPPDSEISGRDGVTHVSDLEGALSVLKSFGELNDDTALLVKGSRVAGLECLVDRLRSGG